MSRKERVFHIVAMITQFGAILSLYQGLTGYEMGVGDSSPINTVLIAIILVVSSILSIQYRDAIVRAIPGMIPVLCFLALAVASTMWSDYPGISLRRSGTAVATAIWGAYLASRFGLRDVIVLFAQAILIVAATSLLVGLAFPDLTYDLTDLASPGGLLGWRGIFDSKNTLGIMMTMGAVTMLYLTISPGTVFREKVLWVVGLLLCTVLLYLSQSRTSWVAALVGVVTCGIVRVMYRRPAVGIVVLAWVLLLAVPAALFVLHDLGTLTSLIGKDATLTGRVDLWQLVLPYGDKRPWLGYGYGAFWNEDSPLTQEIWRILNSYKPPHAHNGWIETYLELGLTGCIVVAVQMLQMMFASARASSLGRDVDAPYILLVLVLMLLFNMVESDLIRAPALFWPFLIIGPVAMTKIMRQKAPAAVGRAAVPAGAASWPGEIAGRRPPPRPIMRPFPSATR
ncbi:MAG TPA: O-antigen ligase family protein [Stellaceae bacterium]|nr:O-antigen ligase family protein [Stellaceae bacterium]